MAVSSSSCSSETSETPYSSDFSDDDCVSGLLTGMEVQPYQFEPEAQSSDSRHSSDSSPPDSPVTNAPITGAPDDSSVDRAGNVNWCTCGHCSVMSTPRESICCKEVDKMRNLLADPVLDAKPSCITVHPEFASVCLCRTVLTISMHAYKYEYGSSDIPEDENRKFQYFAHRQLT